ncbi:MAG: PEP/pyruvate-binding domain-containing protein [Bacteroidia bacterium]
MRYRNIVCLLIYFFCTYTLPSQTKVKNPDFLLRLDSRKDFDQIKGEPLSKNFNGIECVKLVYVLATKKLYYLESKRYKWHYRFTSEILGDSDDLAEFNEKNYSNSPRRNYILATFNYNVNTKNYFLQFATPDDPSDELINILVEKVSATFFKKNQFKILLNSTVLLRRKKQIEQKYAVFTSDELFSNQNYQGIYLGKAKGVLKFMDADSLKQTKNYSNTILILNGNSNQLPVCKAVITNQFQTPLSHICLLTASRKTPCAAQKNIFTIDSLRKFNNKFVEISVEENKISIKLCDPITIAPQKKSGKKIILRSDTSIKEIVDLESLSYKQKNSYGSKVCNLAELKKVKFQGQNISTPEHAFGIPFYFYVQHLKNSQANRSILDFLKDTSALNNDSLLEKKLKKIRAEIKKTALDPAFLKSVSTLCTAKFGKKKIRFRSSSNCEDEANFNGAGLYTSETGIVGDTAKSIETAIKKVWASLWTTRAFKEREFFNIDHHSVYMAVLVHQAFDNEIVNGVSVTKNLYRNYEVGFVINMQKGEEEVVAPKKGVVCEQLISFMNTAWGDFYNKNRSADWLSFSSLSSQNSLLSSDELMQLTLQLESIKKHFYGLYKLWPKTEYKDFAMDVEFKLIENQNNKRVFLFKQARPYNN